MSSAVAYAAARTELNAVEFQLQQLEAGEAAGALEDDDSMRREAASEAANRLAAAVSTLQRAVGADFSGVAAASAKADLWRKRAAQLAAEAESLRSAVAKFLAASYLVKRAREEREARHRLFATAGGSGSGGGGAVDSLLSERASATQSSQMLDEYLVAAGGVLGALRAQRTTFKGAHKRALDIAASLGLSSSLMRVIERRTTADAILVYGGMALLCLLVVLILLWLKR